jgi:copper chaperone CopZ
LPRFKKKQQLQNAEKFLKENAAMTGAGVPKRLMILVGTGIMIFLLFQGNVSAGTGEAPQIILQVRNLTCGDCHLKIIKGLQRLDKDIQISSDRNKKFLIITYPDSFKDKEIVGTIQRLGFKAGINPTQQKKGGKAAHTTNNSRVTYGYCTSTCSASSNTWKEFYRRYFARKK